MKKLLLLLSTVLLTGVLNPATTFAAVGPVAGTRDTNGNGRIDEVQNPMSPAFFMANPSTIDASDFTVTCSQGGSRSVTGVSSSIMGYTLTLAEGVGPDTGVTCTVSYSGIQDIMGNPISGTDAMADGAAPVIVSVDYSDNDQNGKVDSLVFRYSEPLADEVTESVSDFTITNDGDFDGFAVDTSGVVTVGPAFAWISVPVTEASAVTTHEGSGTFAIALGAGYQISDVAGNSVSGPATVGEDKLLDQAKPMVKSVSYKDMDGNGKVDAVSLGFTEPVTANSVVAENQLSVVADGGFTGLQFTSDATDLLTGNADSVLIPLTESTAILTHASSAFTLGAGTANGALFLTDSDFNSSSGPEIPFSSLTVLDGAPAVIASISPAANASGVSVNAHVTVVFSEEMNIASANGVMLSPTTASVSQFNQDGQTLIITPFAPLSASTLYTVSFDETQIDSLNAEDPETLAISSSTFTTAAPQSSGGGGGGGGGGYIAPHLPDSTPTPTTTTTTPTSQVLGSTDTNLVAADKNGVKPGDYIRGTTWSTVYYVSADMSRHPFMDEQTYFTYQNSWDGIKMLPDAALADYPMSSLVLPKAGVVLVKIVSANDVYALEAGTNGTTILRRIPNELTAAYVFGAHWADYVIDVSPAFYTKFAKGADIDTAFTVDMSQMKTRLLLNSY